MKVDNSADRFKGAIGNGAPEFLIVVFWIASWATRVHVHMRDACKNHVHGTCHLLGDRVEFSVVHPDSVTVACMMEGGGYISINAASSLFDPSAR